MSSVSFIVPCYNEEENVSLFLESFSAVFDNSAFPDWELVFIDDGSTDKTWENLCRIIESFTHPSGNIHALRFSRNFGKEAAIWAGLNNATGDIIGIIDADLQQPPSDALSMCELLQRNPEYDCVAAYQDKRRENGVLSKIKDSFYGLFSRLTGMSAIQNASDFRIFRKSVANAILSLPENFRFSKGIFAWVGFETIPFAYTPRERATGSSKWSFAGLVKYAIEGMLAFSTAPLRIATVLGLIAALCAIIYFAIILIQTLVTGIDVPGYATLMSVVLLLGGAQLVCTGIMGEYVARSYMQGKQRPIYIERDRCSSRHEGKSRNE